MQSGGGGDKRQLQVEVSNMIYEFDRKNSTDSVTRLKVEQLIFEASNKFLVNKNFPVQSKQVRPPCCARQPDGPDRAHHPTAQCTGHLRILACWESRGS